ncbi:MAG: glycerophosphodiester phosphodiesterase [Myxococcota bacterium]
MWTKTLPRRIAVGVAVLSGVAWCMAALWIQLGAKERSRHPYFAKPAPWAIAHRGGSKEWPEHTIEGYRKAVTLGVDVLELDVHRSIDGALVVIHDRTVDRTTNGSGEVASMTHEELKRLDAGFRWTDPHGEALFRGEGLRIPTLSAVFETFPGVRFNVEMKSPGFADQLCSTIQKAKLETRVLVAEISGEALEAFRRVCPRVATSASVFEVIRFWALAHVGLTAQAPADALQVPIAAGPLPVFTGPLLRAAQTRRIPVHAFTVNDRVVMRTLIEQGVAGIMTDDPRVLLEVLGR